MSDLTQHRDHFRRMAAREHAPGCPIARQRPARAHYAGTKAKWCGNDQPHDSHTWEQASRFEGHPHQWDCEGICGGCMDPADRALWTRLAERSRRAAAEANAARREDVEWMTRTGEALDGAAARLGITPGALETWLRRQGMHDTLRTLLARNPAGETSRRPAA